MKKVLSLVLVIVILCTISVPCFAANPGVSIKTVNAAAFILGVSVGIGAALFIIKRKSKEEQ